MQIDHTKISTKKVYRTFLRSPPKYAFAVNFSGWQDIGDGWSRRVNLCEVGGYYKTRKQAKDAAETYLRVRDKLYLKFGPAIGQVETHDV